MGDAVWQNSAAGPGGDAAGPGLLRRNYTLRFHLCSLRVLQERMWTVSAWLATAVASAVVC